MQKNAQLNAQGNSLTDKGVAEKKSVHASERATVRRQEAIWI